MTAASISGFIADGLGAGIAIAKAIVAFQIATLGFM